MINAIFVIAIFVLVGFIGISSQDELASNVQQSNITFNGTYNVCIEMNDRYDVIADTIEARHEKYWYEIDGDTYYGSWDQALEQNTKYRMKISTDNCHININVHENFKKQTLMDIALSNDNSEILGNEHFGQINIYSIYSQERYQLQSVVRHEIGHSLGLEHTENTFMSHVFSYDNVSWIPKTMLKNIDK